ncbi:MAG: GAF domain-containing protein [Planctomycetota bacterium]|nr:GAF domain-containing protein [Planctomycetota bacterium]
MNSSVCHPALLHQIVLPRVCGAFVTKLFSTMREEFSDQSVVITHDEVRDIESFAVSQTLTHRLTAPLPQSADDGESHEPAAVDFSLEKRPGTVIRAAMTEMVRNIANELEFDACSVFALDGQTSDLVLTATMGLNQSSVGCVRMQLTEGLVGLVAQELQPVYVENAPEHPRFRYFTEAGEDPFVSFLGVPILMCGRLCGVLVVQTAEPRDLSPHWLVLAAAARQIASIIDIEQSVSQ